MSAISLSFIYRKKCLLHFNVGSLRFSLNKPLAGDCDIGYQADVWILFGFGTEMSHSE